MSVYNSFSYASVAAGKFPAEKKGRKPASLKSDIVPLSVSDVWHAQGNGRDNSDAFEGCYWLERKIQKLGHTKRLKTMVYFKKNGDTCEGCFSGNSITGKGVLVFAAGGKYTGQIVNGKPHGQGELIFPNGKRYEGSFHGGEMTGKGTIYFANGVVYKGPVCKRKAHGEGRLIFPNGQKYEGSFHDGELTGKGTIYFPDGAVYKGSVYKGKPHGQGELIFPNGKRYEGSFHDGEVTGKGTIYFPKGAVYKGPVCKGAPHGKGQLIVPNQKRYEGSFHRGEMTGKGAIYFSNGAVYKGSVCKGKPHGEGQLTFANGKKYKGAFENGRANRGVITYPDGARYEGECFELKPHGVGVYFNQHQVAIEGAWRQGELTGLNKNYLGHPAFLSSLLDGTEFPSAIGVFSIFYDYFNRKPGYSNIAEAFLSVLNPQSVDQIYENLVNRNNLKPLLIYPDIAHHAILVLVGVKDEHVIFEAFNSGDGLDLHHDQDPQKEGRYRTMLQIQVPKASVSQEIMKRLLGQFASADEFYSFLLGLQGSEKCSAAHAPWQKEQKGDNCAIECVFALLKNVLDQKAYHCMRMELFDDCAQFAKQFKNPNPAYIQKLQQKKAKRAAKYLQFQMSEK